MSTTTLISVALASLLSAGEKEWDSPDPYGAISENLPSPSMSPCGLEGGSI